MRIRAIGVTALLMVTAPYERGKQEHNTSYTAIAIRHVVALPVVRAARPGRAPDCVSAIGVLCVADTTYRRHQGEFVMEAWATILWFGHSGDSLVLSADASAVQTTIGDDKDRLHNNVPSFHGRVRRDGTITVWTTMDEERGDSVPYTLRVQAIPASVEAPGLHATGQSARLVIPSPGQRRSLEISLVPLTLVVPGLDRAAWKTYFGSYKVALTGDSLYEICRLPCARPQIIKLKPNQVTTWKY